MDEHPVSQRWTRWRDEIDLEEYDSRWTRLESAGKATHGEADLIASLGPGSVLDAGCGMGRVAIELSRRGIEVVGVDLDDDLLAYARRHAPELTWVHGDLSTVDLGRTFDVVAMPGNVMVFCRPDDRGPIIANLARHLAPDGTIVAGFMLERGADAITLDEYDAHCAAAGLTVTNRWSTWERADFHDDPYTVSVHARPA